MMQPRKDLWFVGPLPPIKGGIAQHGARLVAALETRGLRIGVASWRRQYPRLLYPGSEAAIPRSMSTHSLEWWAPWSWLHVRRDLMDARSVVVPYVSPAHAVPLKTMLSGARGFRIAVVHNALPHERMLFDDRALIWVLRSVDAVLAHSESVANSVRSHRADIPVAVIPHPPNLPLVPTQLPDAPTRLLFFGYVRPHKGIDMLLSALGKLRRLGFELRLTVAGEAWRGAADLVGFSEMHGVSDLVDFRFGYVRDADVQYLLSSHHLVVQPYRSASQSGVIPLAFAAGRGVVVTPVEGLAEYVTTGLNGIVAESVSADALAEAIQLGSADVHNLSRGAAASTASWDQVAEAVMQMAGLARDR